MIFNVKCQRCNLNDSTGILVHLCDDCFRVWLGEIGASRIDITPIDRSLLYASSYRPEETHMKNVVKGREYRPRRRYRKLKLFSEALTVAFLLLLFVAAMFIITGLYR